MQSTGHTSTQALSITSMQGSQIVYVTQPPPFGKKSLEKLHEFVLRSDVT